MGKDAAGQIAIGALLTAGGIMTGQAGVAKFGGQMLAMGVLNAATGELEDGQLRSMENPISPTAALPIVYGEAKIGVRWIELRKAPLDPDLLYAVGALCLGSQGGAGIEDVTKVFFDEKLAIVNPVTTGDFGVTGVQDHFEDYLRYSIHLGRMDQAVDTQLNTVFPTQWPATSKGAGVAYIVLRLKYNEEVYPTGIGTVTCVVRGQKVTDPRDSSEAYSDNPALITRDFATAPFGGATATSSVP